MKKQKPFEKPSQEELRKRIEESPSEASRLILEYYYNCLAIDELNEIREEAFRSKRVDKEAYRSQGIRAEKHYHSRMGEIKLSYPRLRGGIRPEETMRLLELEQKNWEESITSRYVSGESLRDLSRELSKEGNPYSYRSVDRVIKKKRKERMQEYEERDFRGREFLDLQLDGTYDTVRKYDNPTARYESDALTRIIGLSSETLEWEPLYEGVFHSESIESYQMALDELIDHNIGSVYLVTGDLHRSIRTAALSTLIGVEFQPCRFHLQKNLSGKDRRRGKLLEAMFHQVYDLSSDRNQALRTFELFKEALKQSDSSVHSVWERHFRESLAFLDYPANLAKQISTTNRLERSNQEIRRRTDAIYSNPGRDSLEDLAVEVTDQSTADWAFQPKGDEMTATLSGIVHNALIEPLFREIDRVLEDSYYEDLRRTELGRKKMVALRINISVLPFLIEERVITGGLLTVYGIDKKKKGQLIHIGQIRKLSSSEVSRVLKEILGRRLNPDPIDLVITDRSYRFLERTVRRLFPEADYFIDPNIILERLMLLSPQIFHNDLKRLFSSVYETSGDLEKAKTALERMKEFLNRMDLRYPLVWLNRFDEESLLSVLGMVENGVWKNYRLSDFKVRRNRKNRIKTILNNPNEVEKTIKAFVKSLRRK